MLRFLPDDWLEGWLRPFLLLDPAAGLYFEDQAPDWRYALLALLVLLVLALRRFRMGLDARQAGLLLVLPALFYVWTFVSGNGRYFMYGLILVGPAIVMTWSRLPGTPWFRNSILVFVVGLQVFAVHQVWQPGKKALIVWSDGPGLDIAETPLRERPAAFLTITGISYSLLVPRFHPDSRWSNIVGQRDIVEGTLEYQRLQKLLSSPLDKYLVMPANVSFFDAEQQPNDTIRQMADQTVSRYRLRLAAQPCQVVSSRLGFPISAEATGTHRFQGFWFCPLSTASAQAPVSVTPALQMPADRRSAFERLEEVCPRFFPRGDGDDRVLNDMWTRHYTLSDVRVYIDSAGSVSYKYFRALNPTFVGSVQQVVAGNFKIDCAKIDGRYLPPWRRD